MFTWTTDGVFAQPTNSRLFPQIHPPDVVTGIASRIFDQILLVIYLGAVKLLERQDFGDDLSLPVTGGIHGLDDFFGGVFLFFAGIKNRLAVLRAYVAVLPVARGLVVHAEKFEQ